MNSQVNFEIVNRKKILNIFSEPEKTTKKMVIMSHGFRGDSTGPARTFVDFERLLIREGFSVLRFDQPNSGNSEGDYLNASFKEWVDTTMYFTKKYLDLGYNVALFGQSMGATTTMVVAGSDELKSKIPCIILWVPDAKKNINIDPNKVYEEVGQKYMGSFWTEAKNADFFSALERYQGGIHLVYGEHDKYVSKELRQETIDKVKAKKQHVLILPKQDHGAWEYDMTQKVFTEEIGFLKKYF